ncbi:13449_t:CDS:2, partial [Dentiscutata heterogama]
MSEEKLYSMQIDAIDGNLKYELIENGRNVILDKSCKNVSNLDYTFLGYSEKLEKHLRDFNIKSFDYSKFNEHKIIGKGETATVYSARFQGRTYALKCINNNLYMNDNTFTKIKRE